MRTHTKVGMENQCPDIFWGGGWFFGPYFFLLLALFPCPLLRSFSQGIFRNYSSQVNKDLRKGREGGGFLGLIIQIKEGDGHELSTVFLEGLFFLNGCVLFWGGLAKVCQSVFRPPPLPTYLK